MAKQNGGNNHIRLTAEEELELFKKYKEEGDTEALNKLVEGSQGWVVFIARQFIASGMELEDLIQDGNIGLIKAINNFDYTKGNRLSTFSGMYIWGEINKHVKISNVNSIKITGGDYEKMKKIYDFSSDYLDKNGEEPSYKEIAEAVGLKPEEVIGYLDANRKPSSLDYQTDDDTSLVDLLPDDSASLEKMAEYNDKITRLHEAMDKCLKDKEKKVINMLFGLDGSPKLNKSQIANELGCTRAYVGELEKTAIRKLNRYLSYHNGSID